MRRLREVLWNAAHLLSGVLPKAVQRGIADYPGMLRLILHVTRGHLARVHDACGNVLIVNPVLHHQFLDSAALASYELTLRTCLGQLVSPGMTVYDLGANVGVFTGLFQRLVGPTGAVYAFEPDPDNLACLAASAELNRWAQVVMESRAVGAEGGTAMSIAAMAGFQAASSAPVPVIHPRGTNCVWTLSRSTHSCWLKLTDHPISSRSMSREGRRRCLRVEQRC